MADDEQGKDGVPPWVSALGISGGESGHDHAKAAWQLLIDAGREGLSSARDYGTAHVVFSGLLARAQGLHEGTVSATDAGNPYAAFTLLRAYSENTAAILYVKDHPAQLERFWRDRNGPGVKIGQITPYAVTRLAGFKDVYSELSKYAHPHALSVLASSRAAEGREVAWSSAPRFRSEREQILAYAWAVELAEATSHLLAEFAATFRLAARDEPDADTRNDL
jgi:hypothetical protein